MLILKYMVFWGPVGLAQPAAAQHSQSRNKPTGPQNTMYFRMSIYN
jgi:hypothetical protein